LKEEMKWGWPCYTHNSSNVVMMGGLKNYCVLSFFKGVFLLDPTAILIQCGENTQSTRVIRFTDVPQIEALESTIKEYIREAIDIEQAGLRINFGNAPQQLIPDELQQKMDKDDAFKKAFYSLTPGRQRGYILEFSAPKQSKTRIARIEKYTPQILKGEGVHDKYMNCKKKKE